MEARRSGIALTACAPAQLVVDAPAFVTFRAENMQAAGRDHTLFLRAAYLIVVCQNFIESLAILVRCFIELFTDLFHHPKILLSLRFVILLSLLDRFFIRHANLFAARFGFLKGSMSLLIFRDYRSMVTVREGGARIFELQVNQVLLVNPAFLIQRLDQRFAFTAILLPTFQCLAKPLTRLLKFAGNFWSGSTGSIKNCGFERFLGAQVPFGDRPHVMQRFDQLRSRKILVALSRLAKRRYGTNLPLQLGGPL